LFADSIISCPIDADKIVDAIRLAISEDFRQKAKNTKNPYGFGDTSAQILKYIKQTINEDNIDLKKKFFDVIMEEEK
jgi:GDP/UDP-N,N'-diacetylbacillosamine 2-epimerase (hydrolysing)